jgi:hypothetical protein
MFLDPNRKVEGHPIEILEVSPAPSESFQCNAKLRIVIDGRRAIETSVYLAKDRAVVIARVPPDPQAFRILVASRGSVHDGRSPLADAIERLASARKETPCVP